MWDFGRPYSLYRNVFENMQIFCSKTQVDTTIWIQPRYNYRQVNSLKKPKFKEPEAEVGIRC